MTKCTVSATAAAKVKRKPGQTMRTDHTVLPKELAVWISQIADRAASMVRASGNLEPFDAQAWATQWVVTPIPALGGATPASYLGTAAGREMIFKLLSRIESSSYS